MATGQLRSSWGQPTARVCLCCSKVPTRVCTLNNHYVYLAQCRRGGCQLSCVMASKWTQSLGSLHHPVSTHEAAFRAPSNHRIHPDHQYNSPSQQPHGRPPLQTNTTNPIHSLPRDPYSSSKSANVPHSTLKYWLETSTRPPIRQPCHTPLQASSATSLHRTCL